MNVATAPRKKFNIRRRRIIFLGYFGIREILRLLPGNRGRVVHHVLYYPVVKDAVTLADLVNRISWYFPASAISRVKISIMVDTNLMDTNLKSLVPPASQQSYIGQSENICLIDHRRVNLSQADAIMVWNKRNMFDPRILSHLAKVNVVDPTFYAGAEGGTCRLYFQTIDDGEKERISELSKKHYQSLLDKVSGCDKGYLFGTGPSLDRAMEFDYRGGFRIVCNSIVKNKALLRHIMPQLLVFGDSVFHFSPCRYAAEFRRMVLETVERFQCYVMVPDDHLPLYLAHYPELENKIIGMPVYRKRYNFPTLDKFYVKRGLGSIMTMFMLPVASSVAKEIYIIGADGRKPDENYFWTHSSSSQFTDLMQTVFDTHPSFFRDRIYANSYKRYCKFFEGMFRYGESLGKRYYALTPSYIPALAQRPASRRKE